MAIQITITDLTQKVEEGWKKPALAEHYGLPVTQMTKALKDAGLRIRKFHAPKFELVDDTIISQDLLASQEVLEEPAAVQQDSGELDRMTEERENSTPLPQPVPDEAGPESEPDPVVQTEAGDSGSIDSW